MPLGDRDRQARRNEGSLPRRELHVDVGGHIEARVPRLRPARKRRAGIEASEREVHGSRRLPAPAEPRVILGRVSATLCSVCGAVLRGGVCPNGHPQRASRRSAQPPGRKRRGRFVAIVLLLALASLAYLGLVWYPRQAAADLMQPSSREFAAALQAYRGAAAAFPPGATDPQALTDASTTVVEASADARAELSTASAALAEREPTDFPVVSSRPPLGEAIRLRTRMTTFYTRGLEALGSLENVAGYLSEVGGVLPAIGTLEATVAEADPAQPAQAVGSAIPVADQLLADLTALTPPDELGGLHSSLVTIAERVRADLDEVAGAGGRNVVPVVTALLEGIRGELLSFRETLGSAPDLSRRAGLGPLLREVEELSRSVTAGLIALRDEERIESITLPGEG